MKVYAPSDKPLVVVAARESETSGLRDALTRLLGAVGVLGLVSLLVQFLLDESGPAEGAATSADSAEGARIAAETTTAAAATGLPPGLLFFLGGLVVILGTFVVWWYRSR